MNYQEFEQLDEDERERIAGEMTEEARDALGISESGQPSTAAAMRHGARQGIPVIVELSPQMQRDAARVAELEWRAVERFPETIDGVAQWGYVFPKTNQDFDDEMPMEFSNFPKFGDVQTAESGHRFAYSAIVETRTRDGAIVSARWEWHARSTLPYRWQVAPQGWRNLPRNVDYWRPIDELPGEKNDE